MLVSTKTVHIVQENSDDEIVIEFYETTNLLELLNANDVSISQSCGGYGICTTCRVYVTEGLENLSAKSENEIERSQERDFKSNERLCCQSDVFGNIQLTFPKELPE